MKPEATIEDIYQVEVRAEIVDGVSELAVPGWSMAVDNLFGESYRVDPS